VRYLFPALALLLASGVPVAASTGDMSAAEFLAKATALKSRGMLAVLSSDYRMLKNAGANAMRGYEARLAAERAEGQPSSCPPSRIRVNHDVVLNHLRAYSTAERDRVDLHQAVADYYRRTWPCRAPTLARFPR
jgi:hypothetical protein